MLITHWEREKARELQPCIHSIPVQNASLVGVCQRSRQPQKHIWGGGFGERGGVSAPSRLWGEDEGAFLHPLVFERKRGPIHGPSF